MWNKISVLMILVTIVLVPLMALEVTIDRVAVTHQDENFVRNVNVTVRRLNRKSPYLIFCKYYIVRPAGNNVTIFAQAFENLSGRYKPINIYTLKWKMCDFYEKEPFIGQMLARQFKQKNNFTCPFPIGTIEYEAVEVRVENFPHMTTMFTFPFQTISVRLDMNHILTDTEQILLSTSIYARITQNSAKNTKTPALVKF